MNRVREAMDATTAPVVQLCVDVIDAPTAIEVGEAGVRAGVDWLEMGTPMISWVGINSLGPFLHRFPDHPKFLDGKVMDGAGPYVHFAGELGIDMVSICGSASDATIRAGVAMARTNGVGVVIDLYGLADPVARALDLVDFDIDALYLHYGWDELAEAPDADRSLEHLVQLRAATTLPLGVVTSSTEMGEAAAAAGADILLVSHPYLMGEQAEALLSEYVSRVKRAALRAGDTSL